MKQCVLDDTKVCTECGDCDRCDLDPNKICDNCCKCLDSDQPFLDVPVADVVTEQTNAYLKEYYSDAEDDSDIYSDIPYELPDAQLAAEWEQKLRTFDEQEKQHIHQMRGVRKRPIQ